MKTTIDNTNKIITSEKPIEITDLIGFLLNFNLIEYKLNGIIQTEKPMIQMYPAGAPFLKAEV